MSDIFKRLPDTWARTDDHTFLPANAVVLAESVMHAPSGRGVCLIVTHQSMTDGRLVQSVATWDDLPALSSFDIKPEGQP